MTTTYKVRYKNHATPQEQIASGGRYYLDSDVGKKLTGNAETSATLSATGTLTTGVIVTTSSQTIASSKDFIYIKNTGQGVSTGAELESNAVKISLTDSPILRVISLNAGEAFASEIDTDAVISVQTYAGTTTIEYFSET